MVIEKKDFIEIEYTAKTSNGEIFDSNRLSDLKKENIEVEAKPFAFPIGYGFLLKSVEESLIGKEIPGKYTIEIECEKAFGKRDPKLIKLLPIKIFGDQKTKIKKGMFFNFDGIIGKVISVSGGRVSMDFNHPLAGKDVIYEIIVIRKIEDINEKIKTLMNLLFKKEFPFKLEEKNLHIYFEKEFKKLAEIYKDNFGDIIDLNVIIEEKIK